MNKEELIKELKEIQKLAQTQRDGAYTTESDAVTALELIKRLTSKLVSYLES